MPYELSKDGDLTRMRVYADSFDNLFLETILGLVAILDPDYIMAGRVLEDELILRALNRDQLYEDFIRNVLMKIASNRIAYQQVNFDLLTMSHMKASLAGMRCVNFKQDIKALIKVEGNVERGLNNVWEVTVVLDVK